MSCPVSNLGRATLYNGDCLDVMKDLPSGFVDAIMTDPPSAIGFMGKSWDSDRGGRDAWVSWLAARLAEARRVIRPGGFMLCWAIPRTSHWTAMAIEQAGWTIRDRISNLVSGSDTIDRFVDSLSTVQKHAFEMVLETLSPSRIAHCFGSGFPKSKSCLKPSVEDWWLCKAPGKLLPLQIKSALIPGAPPSVPNPASGRFFCNGASVSRSENMSQAEGRWPANLCLSHSEMCSDDGECVEGCPIRLLGEQSGQQKSVRAPRGGTNPCDAGCARKRKDTDKVFGHADSGTAARFYYCAKASRADRNDGCEGLDGGNSHPTVKSSSLMSHLCKLLCPEGGTVLDCFAGSGSTGKSAIMSGFRFVGIEQDPAYFEIMRRRLVHASCGKIGKGKRGSQDDSPRPLFEILEKAERDALESRPQ